MILEWISTLKFSKNDHHQPLAASVRGISSTGKLQLTFTNKMLIPPYLRPNPDGSQTQEMKDFPIERFVDLRVVSSFYDFDSDLIAINDYTVAAYEEQIFEIQIEFKHPNYISKNVLAKDWLIIKFKEPHFFIDMLGQHLEQEIPL